MPAAKAQPIRRLSTLKELAEQADQRSEHGTVLEMPNGQRLVYLMFSRIRHFRGHPFRLYSGERLADMVDSISRNGILMPLIVRRVRGDPNCDYEMLSGHNRMSAGALAGLEGALCVVKEDMPDDEALMYVVETNLFQRSFRDLLPSEKAAVLTLRYSGMFSQGKRNDILRELKLLEENGSTCGNGFHKLNREALGNEYELTGRSIANYVRIGKYLSESLKLRLDNGELILRDALQLSHLHPEEQELLDLLLSEGGYKVGKHNATALREYSEKGEFSREKVLPLLSGRPQAADPTGMRARSVKIGYQVYGQYFAPTASKKEIELTISIALQLYFSSAKG